VYDTETESLARRRSDPGAETLPVWPRFGSFRAGRLCSS